MRGMYSSRPFSAANDRAGGNRGTAIVVMKARFSDEHHRRNQGIAPLYGVGKIGETVMKTFLAGVAFAIAVAFTSQAFALPYCPNGTWPHGHYMCANFDE
jgi:hypothetical protein